MPSVSVIVIVKDGETYLSKALRILFQSELNPCEILVVDGGSRDRTVEIACSVSLVNILRQGSRGMPGKLDVQVEYMARHPHYLYTMAMVEHFLDGDRDPPPGFRRELLDGPQPGVIMETLVARKRAASAGRGDDP